MAKKKQRGKYIKRREFAPAAVRINQFTQVVVSTIPDNPPSDPRELASRYVDELARQHGRKLSRDDRIDRAAERYHLKKEAFRRYKNRSRAR